jgi:hypothetical protein
MSSRRRSCKRWAACCGRSRTSSTTSYCSSSSRARRSARHAILWCGVTFGLIDLKVLEYLSAILAVRNVKSILRIFFFGPLSLLKSLSLSPFLFSSSLLSFHVCIFACMHVCREYTCECERASEASRAAGKKGCDPQVQPGKGGRTRSKERNDDTEGSSGDAHQKLGKDGNNPHTGFSLFRGFHLITLSLKLARTSDLEARRVGRRGCTRYRHRAGLTPSRRPASIKRLQASQAQRPCGGSSPMRS